MKYTQITVVRINDEFYKITYFNAKGVARIDLETITEVLASARIALQSMIRHLDSAYPEVLPNAKGSPNQGNRR